MFNEGKTEVAMDRGLDAILALKARGAVWDCDIELVTRSVLAGRPVTRAEADALFDVECANIEKCSAWTCFLVEAITDHLVWEDRPTGIIDEAHAVLLARHLADLHMRRRFTDLKVHAALLPRPLLLQPRPMGFDFYARHHPPIADR
jgi:hypothetical protein